MQRQVSVICQVVYRCGLILLFVPALMHGFVNQSETATQALTNDDVVAMVRAGLSESVIISSIKNSKRDFQTSANALISLKSAGVSDKIIQAIVESGRSEPSATSPPADTSPLPSVYGYYILGDGLVELKARPVLTKFGLTLADRGFAVDGLPNQPTLKIDSPAPTIIVYQQNVNINSLKLSAMSFVESMQAYQFNIIKTAPQFFRGLYKKSPTENIPINLWRPRLKVDVRVEPITGKQDMYQLTPSIPLRVGRYALYFPDALHDADIVFAASQGRQAAALEFEIVNRQSIVVSSADVKETKSPGARVKETNRLRIEQGIIGVWGAKVGDDPFARLVITRIAGVIGAILRVDGWREEFRCQLLDDGTLVLNGTKVTRIGSPSTEPYTLSIFRLTLDADLTQLYGKRGDATSQTEEVAFKKLAD